MPKKTTKKNNLGNQNEQNNPNSVTPPQQNPQQNSQPTSPQQPAHNPNVIHEEDNAILIDADNNADNQNQNALEAERLKQEKEKQAREEKERQEKLRLEQEEKARGVMFHNELNTFNSMYKTDLEADNFVSVIVEAWAMMNSGDKQKAPEGKTLLGNLFKDILKTAYEIENSAAFNEQRLPEYTEIAKSTNDLKRVAMFSYTDLYRSETKEEIFNSTTYGGLNTKEICSLITIDENWKLKQKSDEAWEIQSAPAKKIADEWLKEEDPYNTMINEMNALFEAKKNGTMENKDIYNRLVAAEWLLINNDKLMTVSPEDPLNPVPKWETKYWKAITHARESLGIPKHISMRDMMQGNYAGMAKAVNSTPYNEMQVDELLMDPKKRLENDSMTKQKEEFAVRLGRIVTELVPNESKVNENEFDKGIMRKHLPMPHLSETSIHSSVPKSPIIPDTTLVLNNNKGKTN